MAVSVEIRKLRKKLRQIENLERLNRQLDEPETVKVSKKYDLRERLLLLLSEEAENEEATEAQSSVLSSSTWSSPAASPNSTVDTFEESVDDTENDDQGKGDFDYLASEINHTNTFSEEAQLKEGAVGSGDGKERKDQETSTKKTKVKSPVTSKQPKKNAAVREAWEDWLRLSVLVSELQGHNDMVTSVAVQGTTLVSASRDTTVKVWDLLSREETLSLGGHTETVTAVLILSPEESELNEAERPGDCLIISGSTDCTLKVWSLDQGKEVKSLYTFNPVTCLDYCYETHLLVTASDGGKVELWDLKMKDSVCSVRAHEDAVTAIKVEKQRVISTDASGLVMVHEIRGRSLVRVFVSDDVRLTSGAGGKVHQRPIRSMTATGNTVVLGDDAINIKLLDWKKGQVRKLVNHIDEFASCDAVLVHRDLLLSSSYNLDQGTGYINVREAESGRYLCSLDDSDEGTDRIMCLAAVPLPPEGHTLVVSGGPQLKLWHLLPTAQREAEDQWLTAPQRLPALTRPAQDSEPESDDDHDDEDDDDYRRPYNDDDDVAQDADVRVGWSCSIL